ncbi:hypothetical protein [Rhizobium alvei]|uniref:Uncharacterized protein n=1 Tax=Rhizobium alvei TaxID=1132659 RepID=A0ABT8YPU9_9HYPH|nr:hypothetical protein [Rhizobium alvei]MDO6965639.1 hypothetical protein [Rhizobium alvei]
MIDATGKLLFSVTEALRGSLSAAVGRLLQTERFDADPFLDPVFRRMSERELADLPSVHWPEKDETSPAIIPERPCKIPEPRIAA